MIIPEPAGNEHRGIVKPLLTVAEYLGDDPEPLDAADCVLYEYPDTRFLPVPLLLGIGHIVGTGLAEGQGKTMKRILGIESFESKIAMYFHRRRDCAGRCLRPQYRDVRLLAFYGSGQKPDTPLFRTDDEILAGMAFFLPGVVSLLALCVFRSLDGAFRAVHEHLFRFRKYPEEILYATHPTLRQHESPLEGTLQHHAQPLLFPADIGAIAAVQEAQYVIGRVALVIQKNEEELFARRRRTPLSAPTWLARAAGTVGMPVSVPLPRRR